MEMKKKIKLLMDTKKIFDENNIEFFPQGGTLLGFIRDGQILPWDPDVDLFICYKDYYKLVNLKKNFEKMGYETLFPPGDYRHCSIGYPKDYRYSKKDLEAHELLCKESNLPPDYNVRFHIGIDLLARDKDKMIVLRFFDENMFNKLFGKFGKMLSQKHHKGILLLNKKPMLTAILINVYNFFSRFYHNIILFIRKQRALPYEWFKDKKKIKIYDSYFNIPSNPEECLELIYGCNWRTPEKDWSSDEWKKSTRYITKYKIRDKNVRDLFVKRGDVRY